MAGKATIAWDRDKVIAAYAKAGGNATQAARLLAVRRTSLISYVEREGLADELHGEATALADIDQRPIDDPDRIAEDLREAERHHLRIENKKLRKAYANRQAMVERIIRECSIPVDAPKLTRPKVRKAEHRPVRSIILPIFDLQYGQLVRAEDTPLGTGGFDAGPIFEQRLERYHEAVVGIIRDKSRAHRFDELIFALGGDFVEGLDIFAGQAWQLDLHPVRQVRELLAKFVAVMESLIAFAKEELGVERIAVYGVPGNHGKIGGKRAGAVPSDYSWDVLFLEMLEDRLRAQPIDLIAIRPGGSLLFECAEHTFLLFHGDEIKGWGGLPYYGITKFDGRMIRTAGRIYDVALMGHHHQASNIPNGSDSQFIVSGDWVGANNLTRFIGQFSRPQQRVLFVSRKWGVDSETVWLTPRRRESAEVLSTL